MLLRITNSIILSSIFLNANLIFTLKIIKLGLDPLENVFEQIPSLLFLTLGRKGLHILCSETGDSGPSLNFCIVL